MKTNTDELIKRYQKVLLQNKETLARINKGRLANTDDILFVACIDLNEMIANDIKKLTNELLTI